MAKHTRRRAMPSTPPAHPPAHPQASGTPALPGSAPQTGHRAASNRRPEPLKPGRRVDSPHLITGTGCTAGHERNQELDGGRLGTVPTKKQSRIGFGLVVWCLGGLAVLAMVGIADRGWASLSVQIAALWLAFAAVLVRRAGHKGRCWRTRTWRHAWGGLVPGKGQQLNASA